MNEESMVLFSGIMYYRYGKQIEYIAERIKKSVTETRKFIKRYKKERDKKKNDTSTD